MLFKTITDLFSEESETNNMLIYKIVEKGKFEEYMENLEELMIRDVIACLEDRDNWANSITELFRTIMISEWIGNRTGSMLIVLKELPNDNGYEFHRVVDLNDQRAIYDLYLLASQYDQEFIRTHHFESAVEYFTKINAGEVVTALKSLRGSVILNERRKEINKYQN